jgi:hypothetical protein
MLTGLKIPVMVGIGDPSCFGKQAHVLKNSSIPLEDCTHKTLPGVSDKLWNR